ncbi:MAG: nitrite reductase (NAD(P)H) small subunit [Roseateles depolymerans]|uniref:Nitrite reductase (NAD(P)H) small subunit n=1 Tax=Roseateles depolymerans TaxID=76731 RepID=A0A2W5FTT7_9BURK|nr:MAG: nitrite reductase (NAD(P)H) small subunit [Roseateles depolymerans]
MSDWTEICRLDDIPVLGSRRVQRADAPAVALFRTSSDRVFALLDRCPHKGGPLSQGLVHGEAVSCPLHGQTIALADGRVQEPDEGCVPRFEVQLQDGVVSLRQSELDQLGVELASPIAGPVWRLARASCSH